MKLDGRRDFHEARWDEPILMEMGAPGQRAILTAVSYTHLRAHET